MSESIWRRRAPLWLRILTGILILPLVGLVLVVVSGAFEWETPLIWLFAITAALAWLIAYRAPTPIAATLLVLPLLGYAGIFYLGSEVENTFDDGGGYLGEAPDYNTAEPHTPGPKAEAPPIPEPSLEPPFQMWNPKQEAPAGSEPPAAEAPGPDLDAPSGGGGGGGYHYELPIDETADGDDQASPTAEAPAREEPDTEMIVGGKKTALPPEFPWPPPAASASYVLPDKLFELDRTVGEVAAAILAALEQNGYVERSFFRTDPGGVAMVTRLERINDDGSPSVERWPASAQRIDSTRSLMDFLHGLFFVDPGHYRVIVFVLQDLPFSQSADIITAQQAHAWLVAGTNVLSPDMAKLSFAGGHVTVLIYEFASDGSKVQVVTSQLTGKQHLERAGVLAALDPAQ